MKDRTTSTRAGNANGLSPLLEQKTSIEGYVEILA